MSTEYSQTPASPDPDAVQRAKREIQGIVQQIGALAKQDISPEQFYEEFLNKVVAALAASGGAVWTLSDAGQMQLAYQINLRETGLIENPIGQEQHGRLLTRTLTNPEGAIIAPHSGSGAADDPDDDHAAANPTDFLLVMAPVHNDQGVQGVVEVFQRPGSRPATQRGYLAFLLQTCDMAGDYLRSRRLAHLADKQSLWEQLESFTRTAHEQLDVSETAFTIANEGRRLIGSDRVTVAVQRGSRVKLEAISGQDTFDKRSNVATLLTKVARAVTKTAEDVWYSGDTTDLAPQVEKAIDAYVDEAHTKNMAILPLVVREDEDKAAEEKAKTGRRAGPPKVLGALIVEQMVDSTVPEGYKQRVDVVRSHSTTALGNALEHEGLFLMPVWKTLGKATWMFRGRTLPKTLSIITLVGGLIAASLLVEQDFTVEGDGELKPKQLYNVFAQISGDVTDVRVKQNDVVKKGDILLIQESLDLQKELTAIDGELAEAASERETLLAATLDTGGLDPRERTQKSAQFEQIKTRIESLQKQKQILLEKQKQLTVKSPGDGQVITWKVDEQLRSRPVQQGQIVMEIADLSEGWQIDLMMPEKRMGHISREWDKLRAEDPDAKLRVLFYPATQPESTIEANIVEIDTTAEARGEQGNTVIMKVEFDQAEFQKVITDPKLGAEVHAKVYCGRSSIAYAWMHDLVDAFRSQVLFRFKP